MKYKTKRYFKAAPSLKDSFVNVKPMQLTKEQEEYIGTFAQIGHETIAIDMLSGLYAEASLHQDKVKKQKCADLMVERAKLLLEAAEKLASLES